MKGELYVKGVRLDISDNTTFPYSKILSDLNNLSDIKTEYSKTITLPRTSNNDTFFNNTFRLDSLTNISNNISMSTRERPEFKLYYNGDVIASGIVKFTGVTQDGYNIVLQSDTNRFLTRLKDINLNNLYLSGPNDDINSYLLTTSEASIHPAPVKFNRPNISSGGPVYEKKFFDNSLPLESTNIPYYSSTAGSWIKPMLSWNGEEDEFEKETYWNGTTVDNKYDYPKYNKDLLQWSAPNLEYGIFFKRILEMVFNDATVEGKGIVPFENDSFFSDNNPYYSKLMLGLGSQFDEKENSYTVDGEPLIDVKSWDYKSVQNPPVYIDFDLPYPNIQRKNGKYIVEGNLLLDTLLPDNVTSQLVSIVPFEHCEYTDRVNNFRTDYSNQAISFKLGVKPPPNGGVSSTLPTTRGMIVKFDGIKDTNGVARDNDWLENRNIMGFIIEPNFDTDAKKSHTLPNGNIINSTLYPSVQFWNYPDDFEDTGDATLIDEVVFINDFAGARNYVRNGSTITYKYNARNIALQDKIGYRQGTDGGELLYVPGVSTDLYDIDGSLPFEVGKNVQTFVSNLPEGNYEFNIYGEYKRELVEPVPGVFRFNYYTDLIGTINVTTILNRVNDEQKPSIDPDLYKLHVKAFSRPVTLVDSLFNNNEDSTLFDYFSEYVKMFNLYLTDTKDGSVKLGTLNSLLKVNTALGEKEFLDWSNKIDATNTEIELSSGVNNITFSTEELETTNGQRYLKSYSQQYGNRKIIINPESNIDQPIVESKFTFPIITDNYEFDYDTFKRIHVPIKLINNEEVDSSDIQTAESKLPIFFMDYDTTDTYNAQINFWHPDWEKGAWSSVLNDWNVGYNIGFKAKDTVDNIRAQFATPSVSYDYYFKPSEPSRDIYQTCWERYIEEIYDENTKILRATINLTVEEYQELSFGTRIYINNTLWRLNSIKDFNLIGGGDCKVELISIKDYDNLIQTFNL